MFRFYSVSVSLVQLIVAASAFADGALTSGVQFENGDDGQSVASLVVGETTHFTNNAKSCRSKVDAAGTGSIEKGQGGASSVRELDRECPRYGSVVGLVEAPLDDGAGYGVKLHANPGYMTSGGIAQSGKAVAPFIGAEVLKFDFSYIYGRDDREDYFEWTPRLAFGVELGASNCRMIALLSAGLSSGGGRKRPDGWVDLAYGSDVYANCRGVNLAANLQRISRDEHYIDSGSVDTQVRVPKTSLAIGFRGEALVTRDQRDSLRRMSSESDRPEWRGMIVIGTDAIGRLVE